MHRLIRMPLQAVDSLFLTDFQVKMHNWLGGFHTSDYRFSPDEVALVHVPKTGGTTLQKLLVNDPQSRFLNLNLDRPVSRYCEPGAFNYLTVMRSPVDRVWSYFQMTLRTPEFPYRHLAERSLETFLGKCWEVRNMACRYYTGQIAEEPSETTLEQAFVSLMRFKHVLSFDRFHDEVSDLLVMYGISSEWIPHERKSSYRAPESEEIKLIETYNYLDIALYEKWAATASPGRGG